MGFLSFKKNVGESCDGKIIAGMDEVGRGPWAGPITACIYVEKKGRGPNGIKDSKKLSEHQRDRLYSKCIKSGFYGLGSCSAAEIDEIGLGKANILAYKRAVNDLLVKHGIVPDLILIDGKQKHELAIKSLSIIKGDSKIKLIACASIIAKVTRDNEMSTFAQKYPDYGFEFHKGYGTRQHQKAILDMGICDLHRKSFTPIRENTRFTK
jgi:ribonuclease HII